MDMARRLRIQFPGALYHIMNRGDRREFIFVDDADRASFIKTLGETCEKTSWQIHAFVLMPNHFHFVVETPKPNLSAGMKWLLGTYTSRFNRRHHQTGHLFSGRYKSLLVGGQGGYLRSVVDYVHLNPARAKLLEETRPLREFPWSSLPLFLSAPAQRPGWLRADRILGECGITKDSPGGWRDYESQLESRRTQGLDKEFNDIRRDWCFGDESFRDALLQNPATVAGRHHYGPEVHESSEYKAERLVRETLARLDWSEAELRARPKGDPRKLAAAQELRAQTTMTLSWIADRLAMGSMGYLCHLLYWARRGERPGRPARPKTHRKTVVRKARLHLPLAQEKKKPTRPVAIPWGDPVTHFDASFD